MFFAFIAQDKPGAVDKRLALRDRHFAYLESLGEKLVFAGALFDAHDEMDGSLMVLEAGSIADARNLVAGDPFVEEGLYASVQVKRWSFAFNKAAGRQG